MGTNGGPICSTCAQPAKWRVKVRDTDYWHDLCAAHFAAKVGEVELTEILPLPLRTGGVKPVGRLA